MFESKQIRIVTEAHITSVLTYNILQNISFGTFESLIVQLGGVSSAVLEMARNAAQR